MKVKNYKDKIVKIDEIEYICSKIRDKHKIVTTNGCFDILHIGHIEYLQSASEYGDILIVGINSDDSVKILKGEHRPVNNEDSRASIVSCLGFVDYSVIIILKKAHKNVWKLYGQNFLLYIVVNKLLF